jgi:uncharacterized protein YbjT (DUF2867 family)
MFLITGAGGGVGSVSRRVVAELRRADQPVRALVRRDDARADACVTSAPRWWSAT